MVMHKSAVSLVFLSGITLLLLAIGLPTGPALAESTEEYCLSCHGDQGLTMTMESGEILPLYVSPEMLGQSIHAAKGISCNACHPEIQTYPHPELDYKSKRELSRAYYLACQSCHSVNYDKTMDSMHAQVAEAGNLAAPICTDCHGAHDIKSPNHPRSLVSSTCGKCHTEIYDQYADSVHGGALIQENNPDVPVCTDCHGVHNIQDPRLESFLIASPELCARCHADQELMAKYGLNADVYDLYKLSWHGVDVSVYKARWPTIWHESALCIDCHSVHHILKTDHPASTVNPNNLLVTCQKCHPDAGTNWTGAWTGHNEISRERTPFVYYTNLFYTSFTPVVLWISAIYVLLQIIRATVERGRRALR